MKKFLALVAVISITSTAFGQVLLSEDNKLYDRFFTGTWTENTTGGGWRDNVAANGDTWLAANMGHIYKTAGASDFVGVYRGATGDVAEAFYTFTLSQDIASWRPVLFEATVKSTVYRVAGKTTNARTRLVNTTNSEEWVSEAETLVYASDTDSSAEMYIDPLVYTTSGFGYDGPETQISNGWTTGHTGTTGDSMQIRFRMLQNDPASVSKNLGVSIGDIELVAAQFGDANLDRTVGSADFSILSSNWGGTGKTWAEADFNGDGTTGSSDFSALSSNWNSSYEIASGGDDRATVTVEDDGSLTLDTADGVLLSGYKIYVGLDNGVVVDGTGALSGVQNGHPMWGVATLKEYIPGTSVFEGFSSNLLDYVGFDTGIDVDPSLLTAGVAELWLATDILGSPTQYSQILVPEPATMSLLGLGGLALLRRRRR